eukprot:gene4482-7863_t
MNVVIDLFKSFELEQDKKGEVTQEEAVNFLQEIGRDNEQTNIFIEQIFKSVDLVCTTISLMEFFEGISVAYDFQDLTNIQKIRKLYLKHDVDLKKKLNQNQLSKFLQEGLSKDKQNVEDYVNLFEKSDGIEWKDIIQQKEICFLIVENLENVDVYDIIVEEKIEKEMNEIKSPTQKENGVTSPIPNQNSKRKESTSGQPKIMSPKKEGTNEAKSPKRKDSALKSPTSSKKLSEKPPSNPKNNTVKKPIKTTVKPTTNGSDIKKPKKTIEELLDKEQQLKLLEEELYRKSRSIDYVLENLAKREQELEDRAKEIEKRATKTPRGNKTPRGGNKTPRSATELPKNMKPVQVPSLTGKMDQIRSDSSKVDLPNARKQTSFFNAFNFFKTIENTPREETKIQPRGSKFTKPK